MYKNKNWAWIDIIFFFQYSFLEEFVARVKEFVKFNIVSEKLLLICNWITEKWSSYYYKIFTSKYDKLSSELRHCSISKKNYRKSLLQEIYWTVMEKAWRNYNEKCYFVSMVFIFRYHLYRWERTRNWFHAKNNQSAAIIENVKKKNTGINITIENIDNT